MIIRDLLIVILSMITAPEAPAPQVIDESCYYLVQSDEDEIRALGEGIGPISPVLDQLVEEFYQGKRSVAPAIRDGTFVFADRCDFQTTDNFVDSGFEGQGFSYEITEITPEDFERLREELRHGYPEKP